MYKIVFSPAAVEDLLKTKRYIAEELGSEQSAINTVAKITEKWMFADMTQLIQK